MTSEIATIAELEACVGVAALPVKMKIIDHLDPQAQAWIAASRLAFVAVGGETGPRVSIAGGDPGFAETPDARTVRVPLERLDDARDLAPGQGAGLLFLADGVGETLRANGRVKAVATGAVEVEIQECFLHCAKALIRSDFWTASAADAPPDIPAFLAATRFLALATMDGSGGVDISPKGDPAGRLVRGDTGRVILAERPGNRLAFGYRNILQRPEVAALCIVPGATAVTILRGRASLTSDETVRAAFAVEGKTPVLATRIDLGAAERRESPALARAEPWTGGRKAPIDPAAVSVAHVKLNKAQGVPATLVRLAINRGLVAKGLELNYRTELY
ncbi:MAG: pyridoxamine 5-phosphate oxidase [Phenylobacterium sp.]|uniref:pyridoxamine 5'-phosphate oxidase family protein n=1 Tax=Phenylobacterium sp. TaxID=1871053 RepID=UPI0025FE0051|nr:pyridoxamine 5'-phosphate oxidase family protein [Phenylobacterium sp.]MBI1198631.1 pyridoxamine 5-phosphate oxidase [Phenylobacterium sp.]